MERLAEIFVLAADLGNAGSELRIDERAEDGDDAAGDPDREDEYGRVQALGDDVRVHEDDGADDATHDHHGRVEEAELRCEFRAATLDVQGWLCHRSEFYPRGERCFRQRPASGIRMLTLIRGVPNGSPVEMASY